MKKVAIIGSGLAGTTLASSLSSDAQISVFEKSRGVGGRMSNRRTHGFQFDHGAQYFTARSESFKTFLEPFLHAGIVKDWQADYATIQSGELSKIQKRTSTHPRHVGSPRMNQLVKELAKPFDIHRNCRITALQKNNNWSLVDSNGNMHNDFDWVICTTPSPQAMELLPKNVTFYEHLRASKMVGCFALLIGLDTKKPTPYEAAYIEDSDLSWLAVNSSKPDRPPQFTIVAHSTSAFAQRNMTENLEFIQKRLLQESMRLAKLDSDSIRYLSIHRWRYAKTIIEHPLPVLMDQNLRLAACGDWCIGDKVEDAYISAINLAKFLTPHLE